MAAAASGQAWHVHALILSSREEKPVIDGTCVIEALARDNTRVARAMIHWAADGLATIAAAGPRAFELAKAVLDTHNVLLCRLLAGTSGVMAAALVNTVRGSMMGRSESLVLRSFASALLVRILRSCHHVIGASESDQLLHVDIMQTACTSWSDMDVAKDVKPAMSHCQRVIEIIVLCAPKCTTDNMSSMLVYLCTGTRSMVLADVLMTKGLFVTCDRAAVESGLVAALENFAVPIPALHRLIEALVARLGQTQSGEPCIAAVRKLAEVGHLNAVHRLVGTDELLGAQAFVAALRCGQHHVVDALRLRMAHAISTATRATLERVFQIG
jgi:hypothetical protein